MTVAPTWSLVEGVTSSKLTVPLFSGTIKKPGTCDRFQAFRYFFIDLPPALPTKGRPTAAVLGRGKLLVGRE